MKKEAETANMAGEEKKTTARTARKTKTVKDPAKTEEAVKAAAKKAGETVAAVKEAAKKAETTVKESAKKAEAVKDELQEEAKKAVAKAARKVVVKETVYLQYCGKEIDTGVLMDRVRDIWTKELKNKETGISSITLYLKPEDNKAYYVVNGDVTGSLEL